MTEVRKPPGERTTERELHVISTCDQLGNRSVSDKFIPERAQEFFWPGSMSSLNQRIYRQMFYGLKDPVSIGLLQEKVRGITLIDMDPNSILDNIKTASGEISKSGSYPTRCQWNLNNRETNHKFQWKEGTS